MKLFIFIVCFVLSILISISIYDFMHTIFNFVLLSLVSLILLPGKSRVLREIAVEMLHTCEGAKINLHFLWHGTAKVDIFLLKSNGRIFYFITGS